MNNSEQLVQVFLTNERIFTADLVKNSCEGSFSSNFPAGNYMFKVKKKNVETTSKVLKKQLWRIVFSVNCQVLFDFEQSIAGWGRVLSFIQKYPYSYFL